MDSCFTESVMKITFNILLSMNMPLYFSFLRVNICKYLLGILVEDPSITRFYVVLKFILAVLGLHRCAQAFLWLWQAGASR